MNIIHALSGSLFPSCVLKVYDPKKKLRYLVKYEPFCQLNIFVVDIYTRVLSIFFILVDAIKSLFMPFKTFTMRKTQKKNFSYENASLRLLIRFSFFSSGDHFRRISFVREFVQSLSWLRKNLNRMSVEISRKVYKSTCNETKKF